MPATRLLAIMTSAALLVGATSCTILGGIGVPSTPVTPGGEGEGEGEGEGGVPVASACGVLQNRCASCHAAGGFAPEIDAAAVSSGALVGAVSSVYAGETYVVSGHPETSFLMKKIVGTQGANNGTAMPPPPTTALNAADQQLVSDWITNGADVNDCTAVTPPDPITPTLAPGGFSADASCPGGSAWALGPFEGSAVMVPGGDCLGCHLQQGVDAENNYDVMGTVFTQARGGADNCRGISASNYSIFIDILTAPGGSKVFSLQANDAGNFMGNGNLPNPYYAQVRLRDAHGTDVNTIGMVHEVTSGSCNSCHTADANGPVDQVIPLGRIFISP